MKVLEAHEWMHLTAANNPVPMRSDSAYQCKLETVLRPKSEAEQQHIQTQAGFSYRACIGELIYALIVARPDLSFAITKLAQYATNPALIHYKALKHVFAYLANIRTDGIYYWRKQSRLDLPDTPDPYLRASTTDSLHSPIQDPHTLLAYSNSDWGADSTHRRSVTGMIILLSAGAVIYKTKYQKAVALSTIDAKFTSATETGKMIIYLRSLLNELGYAQHLPTTLNIDNTGVVFMIESQAPTKKVHATST